MTTQTISKVKGKVVEKAEVAVATGEMAATMIAAGFGVFVIGLMTTLAEASEAIANSLKWVKAVGPLSGKTIVGIAAWLVSWIILNRFLKDKESDLTKVFTLTLALIMAGLLLTFPPFFEIFAAE